MTLKKRLQFIEKSNSLGETSLVLYKGNAENP